MVTAGIAIDVQFRPNAIFAIVAYLATHPDPF